MPELKMEGQQGLNFFRKFNIFPLKSRVPGQESMRSAGLPGPELFNDLPKKNSTKTTSAWVAEVVDARDLKSLGVYPRAGSNPAPGTNKFTNLLRF